MTTEQKPSTALSSLTSLPTSKVNPTALSKYSGETFFHRLQLVTKGKLVDESKVKPGHWAIVNGEDATDLGPSVDVLVLAVREKALDTNDNPPVASFDTESDLYKQIVEKAGTKDSGCMYGPSFLMVERTSGKFLELFFGNASGRQEAGKLGAFLPISEEAAKLYGAGFKAQGPQASTLTAKYIKKDRYSWHAPVVGKCSTPFDNIPEFAVLAAKINNFLEQKTDAPDVQTEAEKSKAKRR